MSEVQEVIDTLHQNQTKSELTSWKRKRKKMGGFVEKVNELEEQLLELNISRNQLVDEIVTLREIMVKECVHPAEFLVDDENGCTLCKFCNKKITAAKTKE